MRIFEGNEKRKDKAAHARQDPRKLQKCFGVSTHLKRPFLIQRFDELDSNLPGLFHERQPDQHVNGRKPDRKGGGLAKRGRTLALASTTEANRLTKSNRVAASRSLRRSLVPVREDRLRASDVHLKTLHLRSQQY